jgi:hypothetical protein
MAMPGISVLRAASVVLLASALQLIAVPALSKTNIRSFDFRNADYPSGCSALIREPRFGDVIRVKNGEWKDGIGNEEIYFSVGKIFYSDLDGDSRDEAIVETSCAPSGANYWETEIYIFKISDGQLKLMQRLSRGDWVGSEMAYRVSAVKVIAHEIRVSYFAGGSHAQPAWVITAKFRCNNGRFVRISTDRKVFKE